MEVVEDVFRKIGEFIFFVMDSIPVVKKLCYCIPLKPGTLIALVMFLINAVLRVLTLYFVLMADIRMAFFKHLLTIFLIDTTILIIMVAIALNAFVGVIKNKSTAAEIMTFMLFIYIIYSAIMMALTHHRYLARKEFGTLEPYGHMDTFLNVFFMNLFVNAFVFVMVNSYRNKGDGDEGEDEDED